MLTRIINYSLLCKAVRAQALNEMILQYSKLLVSVNVSEPKIIFHRFFVTKQPKIPKWSSASPEPLSVKGLLCHFVPM